MTRKLLFNRPAWAASGAKTAPATSSAAKDELFGRHHLYEDIIALERKEKEERARKAKEKAEAAAAAAAAERDAIYQQPPAKKRRGSSDAEDEEEYKGHKRRSTPGSSEAEQYHNQSPSSRSPSRKDKPGAVLINLEDDDDDHASQGMVYTTAESDSPRKTSKTTSPHKAANLDNDPELNKSHDDDEDDADDDDNDPYLRELKAKAREKQRLEKLGLIEPDNNKTQARETSATAQNRLGTEPSPDPSAGLPPIAAPLLPAVEEKEVATPMAFDRIDTTTKPVPTPPTPPPLVDPEAEVTIYINPLIPNTKALIVGRKACQPLEPVKTFWCKKQNLSEAEAAKVFFIWRDMKLFNSSTMQHIVARLQKERKPNQQDPEGRIVLEAVTQELYELRKAELAAKREAGGSLSSFSFSFSGGGVGKQSIEGGREEEEANPPPTVEDNKFIIRLVSKEYGELQIRIRPESTIGKISAGFVQQMVPRAAAAHKVAYLIFDGDRLENEQTADEIGLEEGDVVEVQVR